MMPPSSLSVAVHVALVAMPVAAYFLVLGVVNSRPRAKLFTARQDFALLMGALAPLLLLPAWSLLGGNPGNWVVLAMAVAGVASVLAPRPGSWVIYNIGARRVRRLVETALDEAGLGPLPTGQEDLGGGRSVRISEFAQLRNVSIRTRGLDQRQQQAVQQALSRQLEAVEAPPHPMAAAMLLVAAFMMAAPLALVAREAPQIVRLISDLLQ